MTTIERYVRPHKIPAALDLPPGPKLPSAVQTILFLGLWPYVAPRWQRRYGDVFSVHTAPAGRGIVLTRPEHIREVSPARLTPSMPARATRSSGRSWVSSPFCC